MSGDPPTQPGRRLAEVVVFPSASGGARDRGRAAPVIELEAYRDSRADRVRALRLGLAEAHGHARRASVIDLAAHRAARETPGLDPAA